MIKIFHMADLHLDSPFSGGDIRRSENGRNRLRNVFRRMIKHINERGYDLVLVPGDLYDGGFVTEETAELIRSSFASLSCPVVISPGNHDPYVKGSIYSAGGFSDNVHIFNSEKAEKIDFDNIGVSVWGYAFCSSVLRSNPIADIDTESGRINILCAHADANSPLSPYAPIKYSEMEEAGFTYA
ncbi:MAG: metallophosphoesterase, partial [Ruminococcus bromii]|nr:metallophosphoesterase [Ruminococcus bromii]